MPSHKLSVLQNAYLDYNVLFFSGQLPTDTIVSWSRKLCPEVAGEFDGDNTILINDRLRLFRPVWRLTLLHEMAHLATANEPEEHGPKWNREMRRLYKLGAFEGLL